MSSTGVTSDQQWASINPGGYALAGIKQLILALLFWYGVDCAVSISLFHVTQPILNVKLSGVSFSNPVPTPISYQYSLVKFIAVSGDFNHVSISKTLTNFYQYVSCPAREERTLDLQTRRHSVRRMETTLMHCDALFEQCITDYINFCVYTVVPAETYIVTQITSCG